MSALEQLQLLADVGNALLALWRSREVPDADAVELVLRALPALVDAGDALR